MRAYSQARRRAPAAKTKRSLLVPHMFRVILIKWHHHQQQRKGAQVSGGRSQYLAVSFCRCCFQVATVPKRVAAHAWVLERRTTAGKQNQTRRHPQVRERESSTCQQHHHKTRKTAERTRESPHFVCDRDERRALQKLEQRRLARQNTQGTDNVVTAAKHKVSARAGTHARER